MKKKIISLAVMAFGVLGLKYTPSSPSVINVKTEETPVREAEAKEKLNLFGDKDDDTNAAGNNSTVVKALAEVRTGGTYEYTEAAQLARLVSAGYIRYQQDGPISITKAVLNYNNFRGTKKDVYVVALSGTDIEAKGQSTNWYTDLLSGFQFDNAYNKAVRKAIEENIPHGANIVISGHSLGGMVAQQVVSDKDIKKHYKILNTVCFGSPLINGLKREGTVKRLGDTHDVVPYLSVNTFTNVAWQHFGIEKEDGGYSFLTFISAHCLSYLRSEVWVDYDVTGEKYGKKTLTMDFSSTHYYHAPTTVTE